MNRDMTIEQYSPQYYNRVSQMFHWVSALTVFGLFGVGWWMVELDYYSSWYRTAPHWHKSIGILLFIATILRLGWRAYQAPPAPIATHSAMVKLSSKLGHLAIYVLLFSLMISGYLISTEDGRAISVFAWFDVPALGQLFTDQADIAGLIHEYVAYTLIAFSLLHGAAAIKHHFIDHDDTLRRMIKS